jgi:integrase
LRIIELLPLLPKAVVATASFAGLREGELRGVEWPDLADDALTVNRSVWKMVANEPKTRASRQSAPVIPTLAEIRDEYRASMQNPRAGLMFHQDNGSAWTWAS